MRVEQKALSMIVAGSANRISNWYIKIFYMVQTVKYAV